jgi:cytochrome c biogenesis factor
MIVWIWVGALFMAVGGLSLSADGCSPFFAGARSATMR